MPTLIAAAKPSSDLAGSLSTDSRNRTQTDIIQYAVRPCWLGSVLVASSQQGVCAIFLGDQPDDMVEELQKRFPESECVVGDQEFLGTADRIVQFVNSNESTLDLALDIRGTDFQRRVWQALQNIPLGSTVSYTELAAAINQPRAVRAVANACGANHLSVLIPCHRVVRSDGSISGYRWGVERKSRLLEREKKTREPDIAK